MHYYKSNRRPLLGDDKAESSTSIVADINGNQSVKLAAGAAMVYHGYRRTHSILWALVYGVVGRVSPIVGLAVGAAQGFGKPKGGAS